MLLQESVRVLVGQLNFPQARKIESLEFKLPLDVYLATEKPPEKFVNNAEHEFVDECGSEKRVDSEGSDWKRDDFVDQNFNISVMKVAEEC